MLASKHSILRIKLRAVVSDLKISLKGKGKGRLIGMVLISSFQGTPPR